MKFNLVTSAATDKKLFKEEKRSVFLFLQTDELEINIRNSDGFLALAVASGGAVVYLQNSEDEIVLEDIIRRMERAFGAGLLPFLWKQPASNKIWKITLRKRGDKFSPTIHEDILERGFMLISKQGLATGSTSDFKLNLTGIYVKTDSEHMTDFTVDLDPSPGKPYFIVGTRLSEPEFQGGLQYFKKEDEDQLKKFHSGIIDDKRDSKTSARKISINLSIDPTFDGPEGVKIQVDSGQEFDSLFYFGTNDIRRLKLRTHKKFEYVRVQSVDENGTLIKTFLPKGTLEIAENESGFLLLNSGGSMISLNGGDSIDFDIVSESPYSGTHQGKSCDSSTVTCRSSSGNAENILFQTGQHKAYYDKNFNEAFLPIAGTATDVPFPILPFLSEDNLQFEIEYMEDYRYELLSSTDAASHQLEHTSKEIVTSKGIKAVYDNGGLKKYTFTHKKEVETSSESTFEIKFDPNNKWVRLVRALEKDDVFLVFTPAMLGTADGLGIFEFDNWTFDFLNIGFQPLVLFNYGNTSFGDGFSEKKGIEKWTNHHIKYLFDSDGERDFLQEQWRQKGFKIWESRHKSHWTLFEDPSWKGIMVMDVPLDATSVPGLLKPFIPNKGFNAKYVAFGSAFVESDQNPAKFLARVEYEAHDQNLDDSKNFDFKLIRLNALFTGSEIQSFNCEIKVGFGSLLGEKFGFEEFTILGGYDENTKGLFFVVKGLEFTFNVNSIIEKIVFNGASLSYDGIQDKTKLDLKGRLYFDLNKFEAFKDYLPGEIDFSSFGFDLKSGSILPAFGRTKFDLRIPLTGVGNFLRNFPLKYSSFHYKDAGGLGFAEILDGSNIDNEAIGFVFDLDLGTLGALSSLKNFRSQLFLGWSNRSGNINLEAGFKFLGFSTSLKFNLYDVIGMDIDKIRICQFGNRFLLQLLNCKFILFGKEFGELSGAIFSDFSGTRDTGWIVVYENNTNKYLKFLALGQRAGLSKDQLSQGNIDSVDKAAELIGTNLKKLDCNSDPKIVFNSELNWLIGAHLELAGFFDLKFVFLDPRLYALRLDIAGLLYFEAVYNKISENLGVWHAKIQLPDYLRNWTIGVVDITFPNLKFDCFTNGGFKFDLGFPKVGAYHSDYSDSAVAQLAIFIGKGGFYFAKTKSVVEFCTEDGVALRTLQYGLAVRVGIGREIRKGPLRAGASITVYGLLEGIACFKKGTLVNSLVPQKFQISGRVGVILEVFGKVDFGIVSAGVQVWVEVFASLTLSLPSVRAVIRAGGNISVRASIRIKLGFVKVSKSFSFRTRITYTFIIDPGGRTSFMSKNLQPQKQIDWERIYTLQANREVLSLDVAYIPDISVRENSSGTPTVSIYNCTSLLSQTIGIGADLKYEPEVKIGSSTTGLPGNPLKRIISRFKLIEQELGNQNIPDGYKYHREVAWNLVPLPEVEWPEDSGISRILIPILEGSSVNDQSLTLSMTEGLAHAIHQQIQNNFVEFIKNKKPDIPSNAQEFGKFWTDNFFQFVYSEAKQLTENLTFDDELYDQLEGAIHYFMEAGLRLPNPADTPNYGSSVPSKALYQNAVQDISVAGRFKFSYGQNDAFINIGQDDINVLIAAFNDEQDDLKKLLSEVEINSKYELRTASFAVNKVANRKFRDRFYYPFPESLASSEWQGSLVEVEPQEEDSDRNSNEIKRTFHGATIVELVGSRIEEVQDHLLVEVKGSDAVNSSLMRQLNRDTELDFEEVSLFIELPGYTYIAENADFVIYRRNLTRTTSPPVGPAFMVAFKPNLSGAARFSENPKEFLEILRDATLTNSGGYYIEIESEFTKLPDDVKPTEDVPTFDLVIDFEQNIEKKTYHNRFFFEDGSVRFEKNVVPCFKDIIYENNPVQEYRNLTPPNAVTLELKFDHNIPGQRKYFLIEDYSLLEFETHCGDFILDADRTLPIPSNPREEDELDGQEKRYYRHTALIIDQENKEVNPYDHIGEKVVMKFNWRNGNGERLFNKSVEIDGGIKKYSDLIVPTKEWLDFKSKATFNLKKSELKIKFSFDFREQLINELKDAIELRNDHRRDELNDELWVDEVFTITEADIKRINKNLYIYYNKFRQDERSDDGKGGEEGSVLSRIQSLKDVYHQISDLVGRSDRGGSVSVLLNESVVSGNDFASELSQLIKNYLDFLELKEKYNAEQVIVRTYYKELPDSDKLFFDRYEFDFGMPTFSREVYLTADQFKDLLDGLHFKPVSLALKIKRPDELLMDPHQMRSYVDTPEIDPFKGIGESLTEFSISEENLKAMNSAWKDNLQLGVGIDPNNDRISTWVIDSSWLNDSTSLEREHGPNAPIEHLFKPILTSRWSGQHKIVMDSNNTTTISYESVDIDAEMRLILDAYETYLQPEFYPLIKEHDIKGIKILLDKKQELAKHLASNYLVRREIKSTESHKTSNEKLIEEMTSFLQENLTNFYQFNGGVIFKNGQPADNNRLFVDARKQKDNSTDDIEFEFKAGKIEKNGQLSLIADMREKLEEAHKDPQEKINLFVTHLEHNISEDIPINESNWIQLVQPYQFQLNYGGVSGVNRDLPGDLAAETHSFTYAKSVSQSFRSYGIWKYMLEFSFQGIEGDQLEIKIDPSADPTSFSSSTVNKGPLRYSAVAYLGDIIQRNMTDVNGDTDTEAKAREIIKALNDVELVNRPSHPALSLLQADPIVFKFYKGAWQPKSPASFDWEIHSKGNDNGTRWLAHYKKDLNIFDGELCIKASLSVVRNKDFGENFKFQTPERLLPGKVTPSLNHQMIQDAKDINIRKLNGKDLYEELKKSPGETIVEQLAYGRNGIKHLTKGKKLYPSTNPSFAKGDYYKITHFVGGTGNWEVLLDIDFIQSI